MQPAALALALFVAAASLEPAPPLVRGAPEGFAEVEGRGLGAPGSAALELAQAGVPLRFAMPAGGAGELVLYLAAVSEGGELSLQQRTALASPLGIPGEVQLGDRWMRQRPEETLLEQAELEQVPEPGSLSLSLLGLAMLARLARSGGVRQAGGRWSGPAPD